MKIRMALQGAALALAASGCLQFGALQPAERAADPAQGKAADRTTESAARITYEIASRKLPGYEAYEYWTVDGSEPSTHDPVRLSLAFVDEATEDEMAAFFAERNIKILSRFYRPPCPDGSCPGELKKVFTIALDFSRIELEDLTTLVPKAGYPVGHYVFSSPEMAKALQELCRYSTGGGPFKIFHMGMSSVCILKVTTRHQPASIFRVDHPATGSAGATLSLAPQFVSWTDFRTATSPVEGSFLASLDETSKTIAVSGTIAIDIKDGPGCTFPAMAATPEATSTVIPITLPAGTYSIVATSDFTFKDGFYLQQPAVTTSSLVIEP